MIMRGTTPKSLSWLGLLAVLAIGGFWLTLAPAQSRPKSAGEEEEQVRPQDEIDRKIADVQKMLRELEEQRGRAGGRTEKKVDLAELEQARAQVRQAVSGYEMKRAEMQGALEKYKKALDNLARLGGHEVAEEFSRQYPAAEGAYYRRPATALNLTPRPATALAAPAATPAPARLAEPKYAGAARAVPPLPGTAAPVPTKPPAGEAASTARAIDRLSQQLERLAKDVDELKRSMRRESREPERH
jgi:hypothetical protein